MPTTRAVLVEDVGQLRRYAPIRWEGHHVHYAIFDIVDRRIVESASDAFWAWRRAYQLNGIRRPRDYYPGCKGPEWDTNSSLYKTRSS